MSGSTRSAKPALMALAAVSLAAISATWLPPDARAEGELNIYNWSDYIGENTVANFEKEYNVKVRYDTYDGNETLEAKLVVGATGYDIVFPSSSFFARQIKSGLYLKLDRSKLSNWSNLDQWVLKNQAAYDPGNVYAVPYMWGTNGFTYNVDMIKERMADAPVDSLRMMFDPDVLWKFQDCGVSWLDAPPFNRLIDSQQYLNSQPNKDVCMAMTWSGDYSVAAARAEEAGVEINLSYTVPKEGSNLWFDAMLIPKDAPHPDNALLFLNYMMRPDVIAACTDYIGYANGNEASKKLISPDILADQAIYPNEETQKRMFQSVVRDEAVQRVITREWTRLKTGQ